MTKPLFSATDQTRLAGLERRVGSLERRASHGAGRDTVAPLYEITPWTMNMWSNSGSASGMISGFSWVDDTTLPTLGYLHGTTVGNTITFGVPLGPYGSLWAVAVGRKIDTDGGNVQIEWATTHVNEAGDVSGGPAGTTSSISTPNWEGATFYRVHNTDGSDKFTCYGAAPGWAWLDSLSTFGIDGADGSVLAADGTGTIAASPWSANYFNASGFIKFFTSGGGDPSTYWWCRLRIDSAGTGAGTHARIGWIRVYRVSGGDTFVT